MNGKVWVSIIELFFYFIFLTQLFYYYYLWNKSWDSVCFVLFCFVLFSRHVLFVLSVYVLWCFVFEFCFCFCFVLFVFVLFLFVFLFVCFFVFVFCCCSILVNVTKFSKKGRQNKPWLQPTPFRCHQNVQCKK